MPKKLRSNQPVALTGSQPDARRKRRRLIFISAIAVVIVAAASVGGWLYYNSQAKPYQQAAIRVNDVTFDLRYYINTLEIYYGKVSPAYLTDYSKYGEQEIEQLAAYVEQQIIQNETIKQGSAAFGVVIARDEIKDQLKELDLPVTDEQIAILMAQNLVDEQVPSTQPQYRVLAMLLESESAAQAARARVQAGELFDQVAGEVTKTEVTSLADGDLGWVTAREADLTVGSTSFGDILAGLDTGVLSDPVYDDSVTKQYGYWVVRVVEKTEATDTAEAEIHLEGILVGSEAEADAVIDQLHDGTEINELAKQVSQLEGAAENGAELGWLADSDLAGGLRTLLDLPLNEISAPLGDGGVSTRGGYWLCNALEKDDDRELTDNQKNTLVNDWLDRCSAELEKDPDYSVESLLTQEMVATALNEVVSAQGKGSVLIRTATSLPECEAGVYYSYRLETYGSQQGNTWTMTDGNLPRGLSLDGATGVISGTPELAGMASFSLKVDSGYHYWTQDCYLRVHFKLSVTTETLPDGEVGVYYQKTLEAWGDTLYFIWSVTDGSLPDGLELAAMGTIAGTPETPGTYAFTVEVDDGFTRVTQTLSLTIAAEAPPDS